MANGKRKNSRKKLFIFGGIALVLLLIIVLFMFNSNKENIISVQTDKIQKRDITQIVSATGKINPDFEVKIAAEATGEIVQLNVKEGDRVKKGQLLLKIKPETYIAQRNSALANLQAYKSNLSNNKVAMDQALVDLNRTKSLYEKKLVADADLEAANAKYQSAKGSYEAQASAVQQAEATVKEAEENLNKTNVYSPLNGVVTSLKIQLSERVLGSGYSSGTELLTVSDLTVMDAKVDVDENDVVLLAIGDTARIKIDAYSDRQFNAVVTEIGNSASSSSSTSTSSQDQVVNYQVKLRLVDPDKGIRSGMSCDAKIETMTHRNVLAIPIQSVTARTDSKPMFSEPDNKESGVTDSRQKNTKNVVKPKEIVFVIQNNVAKVVEVKTGISDDSFIEIVSGLNGDEDVVSGPYKAISKDLENGSKVFAQAKQQMGGPKK